MINAQFFQDKAEKIYNILSDAIVNVPYYREHLDITLPPVEEFTYEYFSNHIPILQKDQLKSDSTRFISDLYKKEELFIDVTSGTEGKPLNCYKSAKERILCSNALWNRRRSWLKDLTPKDRFARFYTFRNDHRDTLVMNQVLYRGNDLHIPLNDMSDDKLTEYWHEILKFKPRWIHGPSTAIYNIARHVKRNQFERHTFELIELNGEYVQEHHMQLIKEVLGEHVAIHYGSREFWAMAFSCTDGKLHILDNNLFIEQVYNDEYQAHELLVTTLTNSAWPLIRYRIGDFGEIKWSGHATCNGKGAYVLELKSGRKADYFSLEGGITINAILFSGIIRGLSLKDERYHVNQYQIVKHSENRLSLKLCIKECNKSYADALIQRCDHEIRKIIPGSIRIDYEIVDTIIPDGRTGKCKDFVDASNAGGGS